MASNHARTVQIETVDSIGGIAPNRPNARMHGVHRHPVIGRRVLAVMGLVLVVLLRLSPADAEDRVAVLTRMLSSSSDKTRLSAVLALAKLGDHAAQKPLVVALRDPSVRVRSVAATALGRLGCQAALPALRVLANDDTDDSVRQAASNAAMKIAQTSQPEDRPAKAELDAQARRTTAHPGVGAGRIAEPHADLYLLVSSSADDSPGTADKTSRKMHAEIVRRVLLDQLRTEASVTSVAVDARRWGLAARHIDLSVTRLEVGNAGGYTEIAAELRLAISDDNGKMLSFLSGGARVQVPSQKFDARYLPSLRKEALENAMRGMFGKLLGHLRDQAPI
jgi:HEAT repeat protein